MLTAQLVFQAANLVVLPAWAVLLLWPGFQKRDLLVYTTAILLAMAYAGLIFSGRGNLQPDSFNSLAGLRQLFTSDLALAAGWLHYLCFDLLIGLQVVKQGRQRQMARWQYTLPLPFTFMLGPVGWLLFWLLGFKTKQNGV